MEGLGEFVVNLGVGRGAGTFLRDVNWAACLTRSLSLSRNSFSSKSAV